MKLQTFFLFLFISISNILLSAGWEWQNPTPQGSSLYSSHFFSSDNGIAVGNFGAILRTIDGGINWTTISNSSKEKLLSIHFPNSDIGYIVGEGATVLKSIDGGNTWDSLICSFPQDIFRSVFFINPDTGFIISAYGKVFKTIDGGTAWTESTLNNYLLIDIKFIDSRHGIIVGDYGKIFKTTDCGETWHLKNSSTNNTLRSCCYLNSDKIIAVGSMNTIIRSNNGGETWNLIEGVEGSFLSVAFSNSFDGFAVGMQGQISHTSDGGYSWQSTTSETTHSLFFVNIAFNNVYILGAGNYPGLFKSIDNGDTWVELSHSETHFPMLALDFYDENYGFAASYGHILKTTTGGLDWAIINDDPGKWYLSIFCQNHSIAYTTGYSVFDNGLLYYSAFIRKTSDGGITWDSLPVQASDFCNSISFLDENIGFAVGTDDPNESGNGIILKTTNGGLSWSKETIFESVHLTSVACTSNGIYIAGYNYSQGVNGIILKSLDEGNTWQLQSYPNTMFNSISFPNDTVGFVAGSRTILKTTNSGDYWEELDEIDGTYHNSISFINSDIGYVAGRYGRIFRTLDGGENWTEQWAYTKYDFYNIVCVTDDIAYVSGDRGFILKTTDGGGLPVNTNNLKIDEPYYNIYPNPCDDYFIIEAPALSNVCLTSIDGKILKEFKMMNEQSKININSLPNGIYIIAITSDRIHYVSKIIKN
jgi:photosystem II stability/assembly factor-like uncharacterized protein